MSHALLHSRVTNAIARSADEEAGPCLVNLSQRFEGIESYGVPPFANNGPQQMQASASDLDAAPTVGQDMAI
jgi:hypothetical protein